MKKHDSMCTVEREDGQLFRIPYDDLKEDFAIPVTMLDFLNGKKGDEARCVLSNAMHRSAENLSFRVFLTNTFRRVVLIVDKVEKTNPSVPTHALRGFHRFNVDDFDTAALAEKPQMVTIYAARGRDRLGHRRSTDYEKNADAPAVRRRAVIGRGRDARPRAQRTWINLFMEKFGPQINALKAEIVKTKRRRTETA